MRLNACMCQNGPHEFCRDTSARYQKLYYILRYNIRSFFLFLHVTHTRYIHPNQPTQVFLHERLFSRATTRSIGPETSAAISAGPFPSGLLLFPQPYPKFSATVFFTPATPDFNSAQSALLSFDCNSMAALRSPASYNRRSSEWSFGTRFAKAAITPCDPATSACQTLELVNYRFDCTRYLDKIPRIKRVLTGRQKSDFPARAANCPPGSADATLWSFPTFPHVNLRSLESVKASILRWRLMQDAR